MKTIDDIDRELSNQWAKEKKLTKEKQLTQEDHLESILFQFVNLYDRWSEDRQVAAKQGADIAKFVKAFSDQVTSFESIKEEVREDIKTQIHTEAKNTAVYMGKMAGDAIKKEVEPTLLKLQSLVNNSEKVLSRHEIHSNRVYWASFVLAGVSAIIASLIIVKFFMPIPTLPLSDDQFATYQAGQVLNSVWPKFSIKEKQWFLDLAKAKKQKTV